MLILAAAAALRLLSCKQLFLPPVIEIEQCDRTERSASFAVCTFRDAAVGAAINRYVEERVRDEAGYEDASEVAKRQPQADKCDERDIVDATFESACAPPLVVANVASYQCQSSWTGGAHPDGAPWS